MDVCARICKAKSHKLQQKKLQLEVRGGWVGKSQ